MRGFGVAAGIALAVGSSGRAAVPLYDPVVLNIGVNCQWQQRCIAQQRRAMKAAHKFMAATNLPLWRIHLCNRNAGRGAERVDWVGFNNCIRNAALQPPPPPRARHRARKRY